MIAALRDLISRATPGPWVLKSRSCDVGCCDDIHQIVAKYPEDDTPQRPIGSMDGGNAVWLRAGETEANADLVVALRNAAPSLLDIAEAVRAYREAVDKRDAFPIHCDLMEYAKACTAETNAYRAMLAALDAMEKDK